MRTQKLPPEALKKRKNPVTLDDSRVPELRDVAFSLRRSVSDADVGIDRILEKGAVVTETKPGRRRRKPRSP